MLRDDFNQLLKLFQEGAEGKLPNLEEVFSQSLEFFKHLKEQMQKGTPEEKQEAIKMMGELYTQMMAQTKKITEKSGLTEDQLLNFAENPANFTPEQWKAIQDSKQKISEASQDLSKVIEGLAKKEGSSADDDKKGKKGHGGKHPGKSDWMRS